MRKLKGLKDSWLEAEYWTEATKEQKNYYNKLSNKEQKEILYEWRDKRENAKRKDDKPYYDMLEQLKELGVYDTFGTKKELKELPNLLEENEKIVYLTSGFWNGNTYLIVVTDIRLLFIDKGMIYGMTKHEFPFSKINSVSYRKGMLLSELWVYHGASKMVIKDIQNIYIDKTVDAIRDQIKKHENKTTAPSTSNNATVADELLKYKELLDAGAISEEEFRKIKNKLLNI